MNDDKQILMDRLNAMKMMKTMNCKKHAKEVPMVEVKMDFIGRKIVVGHYCLLCYNFINKANPELEILRNMFINNMNNEPIMQNVSW